MRELAGPSPLQLRIRRMLPGDMDAVMVLQQASFRHPWSVELFRRELGHDWSTILLAEDETAPGTMRLAGFLIFWLVHDELHILNVASAPEYRRRGVASELLELALARARERKCTLATLEVRRSNEAALSLYRGYGFRSVGVRPNYYVEEGEDAIVMVLDL